MAKITFRGDDTTAWESYWKGFKDELIALYGDESQKRSKTHQLKKKPSQIEKRPVPTSQPKPSPSPIEKAMAEHG